MITGFIVISYASEQKQSGGFTCPEKTDKKRAILLSGITFPMIAKVQVIEKDKTPIYQRFTKKKLN